MQSQIVKVTPSQAQEWIEKCSPEFQRELKPTRVKMYANDMREGRWVASGGGPLEFVQNGTFRYLVNGRHRLAAVIEADVAVEFVMIVHNGTYNDALRMYQVYDQQATRSFSDIVHSDVLNHSAVGKLGAAIQIILSLEKHGKITTLSYFQERIEHVSEWEQHYVEWEAIRASIEYPNRFSTAPVNAAAIYTLRYQPEIARTFWSGVISGETGVNTGERRLREYFLASAQSHGQANSDAARNTRITVCSICWNAAYHGKEIKGLYPKRYETTFAGTPLEKGKGE